MRPVIQDLVEKSAGGGWFIVQVSLREQLMEHRYLTG